MIAVFLHHTTRPRSSSAPSILNATHQLRGNKEKGISHTRKIPDVARKALKTFTCLLHVQKHCEYNTPGVWTVLSVAHLHITARLAVRCYDEIIYFLCTVNRLA